MACIYIYKRKTSVIYSRVRYDSISTVLPRRGEEQLSETSAMLTLVDNCSNWNAGNVDVERSIILFTVIYGKATCHLPTY